MPGFGTMCSSIKPLMESQGIECVPCKGGLKPLEYPEDITFDVDLDQWRMQPNRGRDHILWSMMTQWRCFNRNWKQPWLRGIPVSNEGYSLMFLTWRWRDGSKVDWKKVYEDVKAKGMPVYFIGHPEDHELFEREVGKIEWKKTYDLLEMAKLIAGCDGLYCNQGVAVVIAQGLGKEYWLHPKPGKTNVLLRTKNEHLIL